MAKDKDKDKERSLPLWWQDHSNLEDRNIPNEFVRSG